MGRRQLVLDVLDGKETDSVPVGFWFHFLQGEDLIKGLSDPTVVERNIQGHLDFVRAFQPDIVKIMSDGFFLYPNQSLSHVRSAKDLYQAKSIGEDHPWITRQIDLVRRLTSAFGNESFTLYNIFGPATTLRFLLEDLYGDGTKSLASYILEDKKAVAHALSVIAADLAVLAQAVVVQGKADGIYLSVQAVQDQNINEQLYKEIIEPAETFVLEKANETSRYNVLHICGYQNSRNNLASYRDYPATAVNWAVTVEQVSLKEGKRLFPGKTVIGGFSNTEEGILFSGTKQEIQKYTHAILEGIGHEGVILGADCTIPPHTDLEHLNWVRDAVKTYIGE
ncbi:MAG: uroporphyrinogen decarboxylase family protein [Sphaerochaeta sp.]